MVVEGRAAGGVNAVDAARTDSSSSIIYFIIFCSLSAAAHKL